MKCPYSTTNVQSNKIHDIITRKLEWEDADGNPRRELAYGWEETKYYNDVMHDCIKEECAAWQKDRCVRR